MPMDSKGNGAGVIVSTYKGDGDVEAAARTRARKGRVYAVFALLALILVFLSAGSGVALSVIVVVLGLRTSDDGLDIPSRLVLFAASCIGEIYVVLHLISSRVSYIRRPSEPQGKRRYVAILTLFVARLAAGAWAAAVVLMVLIVTKTGVDLALGITGNVPGLELLVSAAALLSSIAILVLIESADRPFATAGWSPSSFIRGEIPGNQTQSSKEKEVAKAKAQEPIDTKDAAPKRRRSTLQKPRPEALKKRGPSSLEFFTPGSRHSFSVVSYTRDGLRVRSQPIPTPLDVIFTARPTPGGGMASPRDFAWRPPMPDLRTVRQSGITSFDQLTHIRDRAGDDDSDLSVRVQTSDASTVTIGPETEPTLPNIQLGPGTTPFPSLVSAWDASTVASSRLSQASRRWTVAYPSSLYSDGVSLLSPTQPRSDNPRPLSRNMDTRLLSPSSVDTFSARRRSSQVLRSPGNPRISAASGQSLARSMSMRSSRTDSRRWTGWTAIERRLSLVEEEIMAMPMLRQVPPLPTRADLTFNFPLPPTGRPVQRKPLALPPESSQPRQGAAQPSSISRAPSSATNFSRPRTAAAALMQATVGRRLQAAQTQAPGNPDGDVDPQTLANREQALAALDALEPRPRTAAAAIMQRAVGRRLMAAGQAV